MTQARGPGVPRATLTPSGTDDLSDLAFASRDSCRWIADSAAARFSITMPPSDQKPLTELSGLEI